MSWGGGFRKASPGAALELGRFALRVTGAEPLEERYRPRQRATSSARAVSSQRSRVLRRAAPLLAVNGRFVFPRPAPLEGGTPGKPLAAQPRLLQKLFWGLCPSLNRLFQGLKTVVLSRCSHARSITWPLPHAQAAGAVPAGFSLGEVLQPKTDVQLLGKSPRLAALLLCWLRPCVVFSWRFDAAGDLTVQLLSSRHAVGVSGHRLTLSSWHLPESSLSPGRAHKNCPLGSPKIPLLAVGRGGTVGLVK